jgi:alcohol dehydrogenase class IV
MSDVLEFAHGPRLKSGRGVIAGLPSLLPDGPVLMVPDANLRALGVCDPLIAALSTAGRELCVFDAVEADPSQDTVLAAVAAAQAVRATCVIGIGGGSPMDVAKLTAYLARSGDTLESIYGVGLARGERLPLVLVPTTAGTGSEATPIAIVTVGDGQKKGVVSSALHADWALLDATLTVGVPPAITAATGIDAIVHAIEAFTSKRLKNVLSDGLARQALSLLSANLVTAVNDGGNEAAREAMLLGAYLAGVAFANAPVAGVHALAYPLGGHFHVPHGLSNALMLPHVIRHNMPDATTYYAELAPILNPALEGLEPAVRARGFLDALISLIRQCRLPTRLSDVGVQEQDLDLLAQDAVKQQRLLINNPRVIDLNDARRLYAAAL